MLRKRRLRKKIQQLLSQLEVAVMISLVSSEEVVVEVVISLLFLEEVLLRQNQKLPLLNQRLPQSQLKKMLWLHLLEELALEEVVLRLFCLSCLALALFKLTLTFEWMFQSPRHQLKSEQLHKISQSNDHRLKNIQLKMGRLRHKILFKI